jgi:large subunit ribosomal protein L22
MVRGKDVEGALAILTFDPHHPARDVKKLIESALANARHNFRLEQSNLYVKEIRVDGGPSLKRFFPRAMGRAAPIKRRTSHVTVVLGERIVRARTQKNEEE